MKVWEENYGADADGNRGVPTTFTELEASDCDDVVEALYSTFIDGTFDGTIEIEINDGFIFNVEVNDYLAELVEKAESDEDYKKDADFKMYLDEVKNIINLQIANIYFKAEIAQGGN